MPYIVTTRKLNYGMWTPSQLMLSSSRRAVATLDDAKAYLSGYLSATITPSGVTSSDAREALRKADYQLWAMSEQGGTVTLPDGTVIGVERVEYDDIAELLKRDVIRNGDAATLLAAYNAAQS